jgi:truncated hemoglobin YjbI
MSKFELQQQAFEQGGVSYHDSLAAQAMQPSIYDRIGHAGFVELSTNFYHLVYDTDDEDFVATRETKWFRDIFSSSTKMDAIENQYTFLIQTFGGPNLYQQRKGGSKFTRLVGRHANFPIGTPAAHQWVRYMTMAIQKHSTLDDESKQKLIQYFTYTAHYIVAAMAYMRSDQLSGGTQMDSGRFW